jgi:hypothetical protein
MVLPDVGWSLHGTKKGTLPISLEKRPCGKRVTIISNITNASVLLSELKNKSEFP